MTIFVENDDLQTWTTYLRGLTPPPRAVSLPAGDELLEDLRYVEIPEEDIPAVVALANRLREDEGLWWYLERAVWSLNAHMGKLEGPPRFAPLRDVNDPDYRFFYVLVFVAALPFVREYHQSRSIPDDIAQATLADLGRNVRVHRKREGIGGLGVAWWLMLHFRGMIYQLGRLQFERSSLGGSIAKSIVEAGDAADESTPALSVHIPDFMGPMTPEACDDSFAQAEDFFPRYFPEEHYGYAVCHSWLLDPNLKTILRPESNIMRFQERFNLAGQGWDSTDGIMQFVFGRLVKDIDDVPQESSLQRGVVQHIRGGGVWWGYLGWLRLRREQIGSR